MIDAIDLADVTILNSPDVRSWPATAVLTKLELRPTGVHVEFTKRDGPDSWPDVPFITPGETLQYTLWIVLKIGGVWWASGCIQFWRGLAENGGPPPDYANNWYYAADRWGPMTGHQPVVGEMVGFFVTAGNARNNGTAVVHERSNVVLVAFPNVKGQTYIFSAPPPSEPEPTPAPPGMLPDDYERLFSALDRIIDGLTATVSALDSLNTRLQDLEHRGGNLLMKERP